ncbi:MAG TPA: ABC transporter ATP-binding protein [Oculatellaceae cyanobacterium]|jgi:lipopolysaccharide transport system ATP-binding protein
MSETIIHVENLGKRYIIGHQQQEKYTALRDVIVNQTKSLGRKLLKPMGKKTPNPAFEEFWALNDVSFEVSRGDRVGIIGRNGAGKSTLLKILSRITEPTKGRIGIKGRVASLLEVGTGFHPELTGRENIFLNGAILGMSNIEIKKKFDEIVAFAEVEKFLDTPVKRYSSGMYVRLAFAVAAHLEPEILIVDEVLAVGDAQFQKKCLGKMEDVGKDGKTVLFVSHNMGTIQQLCNKGILLEQGKTKSIGSVREVVDEYLKSSTKGVQKNVMRQGNGKIRFDDFGVTDQEGNETTDFLMGDTICVYFSLIFYELVKLPVVSLEIKNSLNESFAHLVNIDDDFDIQTPELNQKVSFKVDIPQVFFTPSTYHITLWVGENMGIACDALVDCISIEILQGSKIKRLHPYPSHVKVFLNSKWQEIAG